MRRRAFLRSMGLSAMAMGLPSLSSSAVAPKTEKKANILVILADDLGWMDINSTAELATGTPADKQYYETPNIDKLARDGVSFSRCYSAPLCTPSRATLLTGRNGATFGFNNAAGRRGRLATFAQKMLTPPGEYLAHDSVPGTNARFPIATAAGNYALPNGLPDSKGQKVYTLPEMLSDYRCGFLGKWHVGGGDLKGHRPQDFGFEAITYEDEGWSSYGKDVRKLWHLPGPPSRADYLTDDLAALSTDWIRHHVKEQPDKPFLLYLSHFAVHGPYQAKPEDVTYFEKKKTRGWNGNDNATYAAMIRSQDDSVGLIRKTLEDLGIVDNTIIVFTSDNGAQVQKDDVHVTSNAPLRGQKAQTFEGGIRVPMVVSLAGGKNGGASVHTPVSLEDIAPTLVELASQKVSAKIRKQWSGQSLVPLLENRPADFAKRAIYIHEPYYRPDHLTEGYPMMTPSTVMIEGDYKLIAYHDGIMRLYDLSKDIGEKNDLSATMPERVMVMKQRLAQWRFENIPARYDTSRNKQYNSQLKNALPEREGELFVR